MLKDRQNKDYSNPEKGLSLLEVLASMLVLVVVASVVAQLLASPKRKIEQLSQKMEIVEYLTNVLEKYRNPAVPLPLAVQTRCSNTCNISCSTGCANYQTDCLQPPADVTNDSMLNALPNTHPNLCYIQVRIDPTCGGTPNPNEAQVCISAKWPKDTGGAANYEALTAYFYRP